MPTQKVLEQKKQIVAQLKDTLTSSAAGVIVDYKGISVAQDTILRKTFREAGVEYKVVKNTLLKLAAQEAGFEWDDILEGTTAIAVAKDDVISPAKIAYEYAKKSEGKYTIKGGFIDGNKATVEEINELATIPSQEGLVAKLLYVLNSPITGLAIALNAIAEKQEA